MSFAEILAPRTLLPPFWPTLDTHSPACRIAESRHTTDMAAIFTVCLCTANSGLTGLALDDAIRYFDPNWDGSGKTEEQKRQEAVRIQTAVTEHIEARSALLTEGAFVATQCEGPNSDGKYTVLTGLISSNRLATIAQSVADPAIKQPQMPPGSAIPEQFKNETPKNPDWLAYTQGARVWFNEAGEPVILGFGVAPGSSVAGGYK